MGKSRSLKHHPKIHRAPVLTGEMRRYDSDMALPKGAFADVLS
jgi:hypothetical protein